MQQQQQQQLEAVYLLFVLHEIRRAARPAPIRVIFPFLLTGTPPPARRGRP